MNLMHSMKWLTCEQDSPCDQVILRDINRTFPAHDYFKDAGGVGQDALYKLSKVFIFLCYMTLTSLLAKKLGILCWQFEGEHILYARCT